MKRASEVLLFLMLFSLSAFAIAAGSVTISQGSVGYGKFAIHNTSEADAQFLLDTANSTCVADVPGQFTVAKGGTTVIDVTWNYTDTNACFGSSHVLVYRFAGDARESFAIYNKGFASPKDFPYCTTVTSYPRLNIGHQKYTSYFCPSVTGHFRTVEADKSGNMSCPTGVPGGEFCPPDGLSFGFLFSGISAVGEVSMARPAVGSYDFTRAAPYPATSCLYNSAAVPPPLNAVWQPVDIPDLGPAEVIAWLEPCANSTPDDPYFFWELEVLAVVRKQLPAPVTSYAYRIPYAYSNSTRGGSSSGERVVVNGTFVSTIIIPLRFDKQQIVGPTSVNTAILTIAGKTLSTNNTLPRGGSVLREYYINAWDEYFMTANDLENPNASFPTDWAATGYWWRAETTPGPALAPVCRFWTGETFAPKSSHVYTPYASECDQLKKNIRWIYEGIAFQTALPDATGACGAGLKPLYRVYNNGMGGAPNHRFTIDPEVRAEMVKAGWAVEGQGLNAVFACMPE